MSKKRVEPVDVEAGKRLKVLRLQAGLSQEKVADHLGLTFQQVQKYEKGTNRLAAGRISSLAKLLNVPVGAFFNDARQGEIISIDARLNSRVRQQLVKELIEIDDDQLEHLALMLIRTIKEMRKRRRATS